MPRDGAKIYHRPFPDVVPDTTVESTVYNGFVADVEADLNAPRPITAGGTAAITATEALVNLGGQHSAIIVTNYDSHVWLPGSFYSAAGATGAPVAGHAFAGIIYSSDPIAYPPANLNLIVEARDQNDTTVPGRLYVREKKAGVWGAWVEQLGGFTEADARYVNVAGDTMTGALTLTGVNNISYNGTHAGYFYGSPVEASRFYVGSLGDVWHVYHNTLGSRLSVDGVTGIVTLSAGAAVPTATLGLATTAVANTAYVENRASAYGEYFASLRVAKSGDTMTGALTVNGVITGQSALVVAGHATLGNGTVNGGVLYMNATNSHYIQSSGGVLNYNGQTVYHTGNLAFPASVTDIRFVYAGDWYYTAAGIEEPYGGHACVTGGWTRNNYLRHRYCQMLINGAWANANVA